MEPLQLTGRYQVDSRTKLTRGDEPKKNRSNTDKKILIKQFFSWHILKQVEQSSAIRCDLRRCDSIDDSLTKTT